MSYLERIRANILPVSEASTVTKALKEWAYTGETTDYGAPIEVCQLCDQKNLRYHFEIENEHNHNSLLIGSECILRFKIGVVIDGEVVHGEVAEQKVRRDRSKMIEEARVRRVFVALMTLWQADADFQDAIYNMMEYLNDHGAFTPKQMGLLAWRMEKFGVDHAPRDFKIILRRNREKDQIRQMEDWKLGKLWPYLSSQQQVTVLSWGVPHPLR